MKIKTVGLLAGAAMMLTSLTVWSVTPAGGFGDRVAAQAEASSASWGDPLAQLKSWTFTAGERLMVEGRLGHATLDASRDNETFLFVDVNAPAGATATAAAPVNLAIVIDRSGSMRGKRLDNAVEAARGMVRRLRDGDVVSVVTYDTNTETLVPATTIDASTRQGVVEQIRDIAPGGDTCISCALDAGMAALSGRDGMVKRMLLLSDGEATSGVRDVQGFRNLASRARDMGCSISSVGVDVDYNERIMTAIASESNGRHYFVEDVSRISHIFDQELQSLVTTVATGAEMRIDLAPGVQLLQVMDRSFRREGNSLVVPMGSFAANDDKTVLLKVRVPRGAEGPREVASVSLAFNDLVSGGAGSCNGTLLAKLSGDPTQASQLDPIVAGRLGRAETAAVLREANQLFAQGDFSAARNKIATTKSSLARRKVAFGKAAPAPRKDDVNRDFDRQLAALDEAEDGFASPPPAAAAGAPSIATQPNQTRAGKAQVRKNAEQAADLAF